MQTAWPFPPLCGWALRQRVKVTDAPALVSDTKAYLRSKVKDDAVDPSPVKEPLPDDSETAADDARTLTVDYDDQGERYKAWRDVCREARSMAFPIGHMKVLRPRSTSSSTCRRIVVLPSCGYKFGPGSKEHVRAQSHARDEGSHGVTSPLQCWICQCTRLGQRSSQAIKALMTL